MKKLFFQLFLAFVMMTYLTSSLEDSSKPPTYGEKYRPRYHFTSPKNWINDPNGLIFFGGVYQMYYQYNPYSSDWGHMSWGHAVSTDLVHWKNLPVAIPEYDGVQIFSGCNIIDVNNTSGFCKAKECLLAFYTAQTDKGEAQAFAYSNDFGLSYTQYAGNPIIDEGLADHRDPKVFWYEPGRKWIMITALPMQFKCRLYSSTDLKKWTHLSDFGVDGSTDGMWEDPDLFELPDEDGNMRWVLTHSVDVSKVEYYIGTFDGTTFTNTESISQDLYFDYGRDFTEAATFSNEPKGRRLIWAWLDEGIYGGQTPTEDENWRGSLTLIRELKIKRYSEGLRIVTQPIEEYTKLRNQNKHLENVQLGQNKSSLSIQNGNQVEIIAVFTLPNDTTQIPKEFGFKVFVGEGQWTTIGYNYDLGLFWMDRYNSGEIDFNPAFPCTTYTNLLYPENGQIQFRIFLDQNSVEVFANNGKIAMSNAIYPDPNKNEIIAYAIGGQVTLTSLDTWTLNSIWNSDDLIME